METAYFLKIQMYSSLTFTCDAMSDFIKMVYT